MMAVIQRHYGTPDDLELAEVECPTPAADEVLVRVRAAAVHPDVWHVVTGQPAVLRVMGAGLRRPTHPIPGTDLAGEVEAVGDDVNAFDPGDGVFGEVTGGTEWVNGGTYAEFATAPADQLAAIPASISHEAAAAVPNAGIIAFHHVHELGDVAAGDRVLVNGAGGGVGTIAVQLAAAAGADVTGVDSAGKLDTVGSLGADTLIDYEATDFTDGDERYDLVVDVAGTHPYGAVKRVLAPDGQYLLIGHDHYGAAGRRYLGSIPRFLALLVRSRFDDHLSGMGFSSPNKGEVMAALAECIEAGTLEPVVDSSYPLEDVVEALRHLESGDVCGRVVLTV